MFDGGSGQDTVVVDFSSALYLVPGGATSVTFGKVGDTWVFALNGATKLAASNVEAVIVVVSADHSTLIGGAGDDSFFIAKGDAVVAGAGGNDFVELFNMVARHLTLDGGSGQDMFALNFTPETAKSAEAPIVLDLRGAVGSLTIGALSANLTGFEPFQMYRSAWSDVVHCGDGNDAILQNAASESGNDLFDGGGGDDTLSGGRGNDTLLVGSGNDKLYGGWALTGSQAAVRST